MGGIHDFRQGPFSALGIPNNPTGSFDFDRMAGTTRVPNSVKYRSPVIAGFSVGALCGFGANYENGTFGLGAAYVEEKYPQLGNGNDGIRNFGFGAHYQFGSVLGMLLYTNTKNTASGAEIDVYKAGALWTISGSWSAGLDYQYMKGNKTLQDNRAQQVMSAVQYHFSKRTMAYVEAVYQHASGDAATTSAWIDGLLQPDGASSTRSQVLARVGLRTSF